MFHVCSHAALTYIESREYACVCVCVCVYIHARAYIHTHTHTILTYTHTEHRIHAHIHSSPRAGTRTTFALVITLALVKRERAQEREGERERERERERETSSVNLSPRPSLRVQINASPCAFCARNKKTLVLVSVFERAALRSRVCVSVHVHNLQSQELEGTHEHDTDAIPRRGSEQIGRHSWSACTKTSAQG